MYCVLVAGPPASGKSTLAEALSRELRLPVFSKDSVKELLFDAVGFRSRAEKVALGTAGMEILYYFAQRLMEAGKPFILENNFENASAPGLRALLERYGYTAVTVRLTGDLRVLYSRYLEREKGPGRHRGHVVNDRYPEEDGGGTAAAPLSFEQFRAGIAGRGMDSFSVGGPVIAVDTTDISAVCAAEIAGRVRALAERAETAQKGRKNDGEEETQL